MPETARLLGTGALSPMRSSLPEVSNVAWSSVITGRDPGGHGIFGFTDWKPGSLDVRFPTFADLRAEPLWAPFERAGRPVIVANVPATYPAPAVGGVLVAGFVAPRLEKAVFPPAWLPRLRKMGYEVDTDMRTGAEDPAGLLARLRASLEKREALFRDLAREPWDLFFAVVTETDRLHHFLWDAGADPGHPLHQGFLDFYRAVDRAVAFAAGLAGPDDLLILLSDHGFGPMRREVMTNRVLERLGFARFNGPELKSIAPESVAVALDPGRIYVHARDRFPGSAVDPARRAEIAAEVGAALERFEVDGVRPAARVYRNAEAYHGPHAPRGPDLVVEGADGFDWKASLERPGPLEASRFTGRHTLRDAFLFVRGAGAPAAPTVADVAGILELPR